MTPQPAVDNEVTLVIPTVGRGLLRDTLESVMAGTVWPARVIIVDQGRKLEIRALVQDVQLGGLRIEYVPSMLTGRSAGVNVGIANVATRFVVITDDDCPVAPDWIACMGARLRRHAPAIVTGRVVAGEGGVQLAVVTSEVEVVQRRPSLRFDRMSGGNMGMPVDVARRLGPFIEDPSMRTAEDTEFAYRALRRGMTLVYAPEVVVQHLGWRDEAERRDQYQSYAHSHGAFYGAYLRQGDLFILLRLIVHLFRALRRWIRGNVSGNRDVALNGKAYVVGLLPGLWAGWHGSEGR